MQEDYETFVSKVMRQHNSLMLVLPFRLCRRLDIKPGTYLVVRNRENSRKIELQKLEDWRPKKK